MKHTERHTENEPNKVCTSSRDICQGTPHTHMWVREGRERNKQEEREGRGRDEDDEDDVEEEGETAADKETTAEEEEEMDSSCFSCFCLGAG